MKIKPLLILLLFSLTSNRTFPQRHFSNEFGFRSDNDAYLFYGQDQYYTNGLFITWRHAMKLDTLSSKLEKKILEVEVGQKMYNPTRGDISDINRIDRPFAGYLYSGGALNLFYKNEKSLKLSAQIGVLGPASFGEETQRFLHKTVGFYPIEGWEFQVKNEIALNASVEYNSIMLRTADKKSDITFSSYVNIGNTYTSAGAGMLFRSGNLNQLYNSSSLNSVIGNSTDLFTQKELFFYAKPMLSFIAYDGSIEGGLFRKDKGPVTFKTKPVVLSSELGLMYAKDRFTAAYFLTFKSKEVVSPAKQHQYGTFNLYYRFN